MRAGVRQKGCSDNVLLPLLLLMACCQHLLRVPAHHHMRSNCAHLFRPVPPLRGVGRQLPPAAPHLHCCRRCCCLLLLLRWLWRAWRKARSGSLCEQQRTIGSHLSEQKEQWCWIKVSRDFVNCLNCVAGPAEVCCVVRLCCVLQLLHADMNTWQRATAQHRCKGPPYFVPA
jgi:hypothetical protein